MDSSPFGRLPAELRNHIYELIIPERASMSVNVRRRKIEICNFRRMPGYVAAFKQKHAHARALAATCEDLRRECMGLFYATHDWNVVFEPFYKNTDSVIHFRPTHRPRGFGEIHDWLATMGPDLARCIRSLKLLVKEDLGFVGESPSQQHLRPTTEWLASSLSGLKTKLHDNACFDIVVTVPIFYSSPDRYHAIECHSKDPDYAATSIDAVVQAQNALSNVDKEEEEIRSMFGAKALADHKTLGRKVLENAKSFCRATAT